MGSSRKHYESVTKRAKSRNGISPRFVIVGGTAKRTGLLRPQTLLILAREIGLGRTRVARDQARIEGPRQCLIAALLGEQALLVQRGRSARRLRKRLHEMIVHRRRGIGCRLLEAFTDIEQRIRRALVGREDPQEFPKPQPGGRETAAPVLLQRDIVHLIGAGTGWIA